MKDESILELLKDEHVDLLIRLAFELEAYQLAEQLESDGEKDFTEEEKRITEQALAAAYERLRQQELNERRDRRAAHHRRRLMRVVEVLACAVVVIGISAPVAVANFETLRQKIVEFLVSFDGESETTRIQHLDGVTVPDSWVGKYFPTFLPIGTRVAEISSAGRAFVRFSTEDGAVIVFVENDDDSAMIAGAADETVTITDVNGYEARVAEFFEDEYFIRIVWNNGDRWFILETANLDIRTAHSIAESVRRISD